MYVPGQDLGGLNVDFGAVQLGRVDTAGTAWTLQTMDGWDAAEIRTQITQREYAHGSWMGPSWLSERPVTLTGTIVAPNRAGLDGAIEQLLAADALGDMTLVVYETIPKQATVRRSGKPIVTRVTDSTATYSLLVTAPDPRRYSTTQQSQATGLPLTTGGLTLPAALPWTLSASSATGTISAINTGTIAVQPVFTIAGPVTEPQVATRYPDGTVRTLAYSQSLLAGETLTIDTDAHTVMIGGASRRRWLSGPWPDIPAGTSVTIQFLAAAYSSTATLTVTWRSAWI